MNLLEYILMLTSQLELLESDFSPDSLIENDSKIAILSSQLGFWEDLIASRPTILRGLSNRQQQNLPVDLYLIDLQENDFYLWTLDLGKALLRNANTKFIFVIEKQELMDTIIRDVLKLGFCHVEILLKDSNFSKIVLQDHCSGLGSDLILAEHNCKANVSFIDLPPNTIPVGDDLLGYEGQIFRAVANHLAIGIDKYINYHEAGFGSFTPPTLLQGDILKRNVLVALGGIYPFYERQVHADSVFSCASMQVIWSVPSQAGPSSATWYIILISEFSIPVWICALLFYLSLVVACPLFEEVPTDYGKNPLYILALLLGQSQLEHTQRGFSLSIMFFGLLFTNYYLAVMSSKLTLPAEIPELKTMRELADTKLDFVSTPFIRKVVESVGQNTYSTGKIELASKCRAVSESSHDVLLRIAEKRDAALARHDNYVKFIYNYDPQLTDKVHFMEEPVTEFYPIVLMPKHSCLRKRVQLHFRRMCESGIGLKWFKDLTTLKNDKEKGGVKQLAIEHIRGFLLLLFLGLFIAFLAFIGEIFWGKMIQFAKTRKKVAWKKKTNLTLPVEFVKHIAFRK